MRALLIDGLNLVRRVYAAVEGSVGTEGTLEAATPSILGSALRAVNDISPSHALCVFESGDKSWRHGLHPEYKAGRAPMPEDLQQGLTQIQEDLAARGLKSITVSGFEAEDILATVAHKIASRGGRVVVLSTDKSMCQLLNDRIQVRDHFNQRFLDVAYVQDKFGVPPSLLPTWLALVGDRSLNVPGVKSIGSRTATRLISELGPLENVLGAAATMSGKVGRALRECGDDARLSLQLVTLRTDVEIGVNLSEFRYPQREDSVQH